MRESSFTRRGFLGAVVGAGVGKFALPALAAAMPNGETASQCPEFWERKSTSNQPPRKVIVGTVMQPFWGQFPGLDQRLRQLTDIVEQMDAQSQRQYGRGLDLAVLPETSVTGEGRDTGSVMDWAFPLEGAVQQSFAAKARQRRCYIVAPLFLLEDKETKRCSNAAVLFDRQGQMAGIYRKAHPVVDIHTGVMEHGVTPGMKFPVFNCDFGKLGMQICFDINFEYGWRQLAQQGAEIVAWPTQSPQTVTPACRALDNNYYIVSSTWRNNASIFDPIGKISSQVRWTPEMGSVESVGEKPLVANTLVEEIDLSYAILEWNPKLENGKAFTRAFGDKAGYRYYDDDDRGIFWSNDPKMTVRQMLQSLNLIEQTGSMDRTVAYYSKAGVPGY